MRQRLPGAERRTAMSERLDLGKACDSIQAVLAPFKQWREKVQRDIAERYCMKSLPPYTKRGKDGHD